jgi:queuine tRNA-ribosyltransferase
VAFSFELFKEGQVEPRLGRLVTAHGGVDTPAFMPVGTQATVKALTPGEVRDAGAQIVLANTYHLYLRPGSEVVKKLGGVQEFMGWRGPVLTDSGGFQVFSLSSLRKIDDRGATFKSHIDGSTHFLGPEESIHIQHDLGADIIMCFDECIEYPTTHEKAHEAMLRTLRWAERCKLTHDSYGGKDQALFGIVQGSVFPEERALSAAGTVALDFPGYAIGGLSVGEPKDLMEKALLATTSVLPADRPRYLMGVGTPEDIILGVRSGVDMFDCVLPTRAARHGAAFTYRGRVLLKNKDMADDSGPIEEGCDCYTCRNFSRGYIRHLFKAGEPLALTLASLHNLRFMARFMADMRGAIGAGDFDRWAGEFRGLYRTMAPKGTDFDDVENATEE